MNKSVDELGLYALSPIAVTIGPTIQSGNETNIEPTAVILS